MKKKIAFYAIYLLFIVVLFEFVFRAFYAISFKDGSILYRPFAALGHYYPGLLDLMDTEVSNTDEQLDILLLGGSVMTSQWGNVPEELEKQIKAKTNRPFKIYNLATPAHTSRDSRVKFELLKNQHFDVVILYHGINEVRFNHCPPEVFKSDYSHVDFYAKTNALARRTWSKFTVLPLVFIQLKTNLLRTYAEDNFMPFHAPVKDAHQDWIAFGLDVKTRRPFSENFDAIIRKAMAGSSRVIVPQFAFHIPDNYSLEAFKAQQLDYGRHRNPVELWGTVATVTKGIDSHNEVVAGLQTANTLQPINMNAIVPHDAAHFDDLCHFTPEGSARFVEALLPLILQSNSGQ